jgi:hypothetical protein
MRFAFAQTAPYGSLFSAEAIAKSLQQDVFIKLDNQSVYRGPILWFRVRQDGKLAEFVVNIPELTHVEPAPYSLSLFPDLITVEDPAVVFPGPVGGSDPVLDAPHPLGWCHDYGLDGRPITPEQAGALKRRTHLTHLALDEVDSPGVRLRVSTIFTVLDYGWGEACPVLWETLVSVEPSSETAILRWSSRADAENGHSALVQLVREAKENGPTDLPAVIRALIN